MGIFDTPGPTTADIVRAGIIAPVQSLYATNLAAYITGMMNFWRGKMGSGSDPRTGGMTPQEVSAALTAAGANVAELVIASAGLRDYLNELGAGLPTTIPGAIYSAAPVYQLDGNGQPVRDANGHPVVVTPGFDWEDVPQTLTINQDGSVTITTPPMSTPPTSPPATKPSFTG